MSKALVIGSISYDKIFSISGKFRDGIILKDGKIANIDMTSRGSSPRVVYGGIGGNISSGIALLEKEVILCGIVGEEFSLDYQEYLEKLGVDVRVEVDQMKPTATFYGITDENHETFSIWQPNCSEDTFLLDLNNHVKPTEDISVIIASPMGAAEGIEKYIEQARRLFPKATIIFDPGQDLSYLKKEMFENCLKLSDILIVNETEYAQVESRFKFDRDKIFKKGIKNIIITLGAKGSKVVTTDIELSIPAAKPREVVQVTGAGDAYRAGFISGLLSDLDIEECARFGSVMGSFAVETIGAQSVVVKKDFNERLITMGH